MQAVGQPNGQVGASCCREQLFQAVIRNAAPFKLVAASQHSSLHALLCCCPSVQPWPWRWCWQALSGEKGFLTKARLARYDEKRNDPSIPSALSGLSPYLHFGQLAPQRAAIEAAKYKSVHKVGDCWWPLRLPYVKGRSLRAVAAKGSTAGTGCSYCGAVWRPQPSSPGNAPFNWLLPACLSNRAGISRGLPGGADCATRAGRWVATWQGSLLAGFLAGRWGGIGCRRPVAS